MACGVDVVQFTLSRILMYCTELDSIFVLYILHFVMYALKGFIRRYLFANITCHILLLRRFAFLFAQFPLNFLQVGHLIFK
jgi:hypothetical protein